MVSSLDKLSSNLKINQFVNLKKYYSGNQLSLLLRKGVYPYDYVDCLKKLDETSLPPKDAFYSKLSGESITDEDYQHAQAVWKELKVLRHLKHTCLTWPSFDVCKDNSLPISLIQQ